MAKIVLIGSGNVATQLGKKIKKSAHTIVQIYARNASQGNELAHTLDSPFVSEEKQIFPHADFYIIAVKDAAIGQVAAGLYPFISPPAIVVHTSGATSIQQLKQFALHGVLYPLQSLRKESKETDIEIPLLVDGNSEETKKEIRAFAHSISGKIGDADDQQRIQLHIAAVFSSNFTNYLFALAEKICRENHLDFHLLQPLITETVTRLQHSSPKQWQTGPAIRKDQNTLALHESLLSADVEAWQVYRFLTHKIMETKIFE